MHIVNEIKWVILAKNARIKKLATEKKNNFDGLISRMDTAHEKIRECKDRAVETIQK